MLTTSAVRKARIRRGPVPNNAAQRYACEDVAMIEIDALWPSDRDAWEVLARGYKAYPL